jgi:gas vesicle protein
MEYKLKSGQAKNHFIWEVYSKGYKTGLLTREQAGEVCQRELGLDFDESAFRKKYEAFESMWEEVKEEYLIESDDLVLERLAKIEEKEDELYKQQVKARDWTREKRKTLRDEARVENLKDSFSYVNKLVPEVLFNKYESKHVGEKEAVLMLSDFHVGLEIKNYWGQYNTQVFKDRINQIIHKVMRRAEVENIGTLYVAGLGDLISGSIHVTTRLAEEIDTLEQVYLVSKVMKSMLKELSAFGLDIKYLSVVGNHDRKNKLFKEHVESESFNKLVDWYIQDAIEDGLLDIEYIHNEIDDGIGMTVINGENCVFVHGHQDGVKSVVFNMIKATGIIPKYVFMGHYHSKVTDEQEIATVFVNGCLDGVDGYAKDKRYFSKPSQTLVVFEDDDVIDIKLSLK